MVTRRQKITIGALVLTIVAAGIYIELQGQPVKVFVTNETTTFYTLNENSSWVVQGREYNRLYRGGTQVYRVTKSMKVTFERSATPYSDEEDPTGNYTIVIRYVKYQSGSEIIDRYVYLNNVSLVELFPVDHMVTVVNGQGLYYRYAIDELSSTHPREKLGDVDFMDLGMGMNVQLDGHDRRWCWLGWPYGEDSLSCQYDVKTNYEVFHFRFFDPPGDKQFEPVVEKGMFYTHIQTSRDKHNVYVTNYPQRVYDGGWKESKKTQMVNGSWVVYTEIDKDTYVEVLAVDGESALVNMSVTSKNDKKPVPVETDKKENYTLDAGKDYVMWIDLGKDMKLKFGKNSTQFNIIRTSLKNGFYLTGTIGYPPLSGTYSAQAEGGGLNYLGWYSTTETDVIGIPFNLTGSGIAGDVDYATFQIRPYSATASPGYNLTLYMINGSGGTDCVIPPNLTAWNENIINASINTSLGSDYDYTGDPEYSFDVTNEMQTVIERGYSCPVIGFLPGVPQSYGGNYTRWYTSSSSLNVSFTASNYPYYTLASNGTNTTVAGAYTNFYESWNDDVALSASLMEYCNGTWNGTDCLTAASGVQTSYGFTASLDDFVFRENYWNATTRVGEIAAYNDADTDTWHAAWAGEEQSSDGLILDFIYGENVSVGPWSGAWNRSVTIPSGNYYITFKYAACVSEQAEPGEMVYIYHKRINDSVQLKVTSWDDQTGLSVNAYTCTSGTYNYSVAGLSGNYELAIGAYFTDVSSTAEHSMIWIDDVRITAWNYTTVGGLVNTTWHAESGTASTVNHSIFTNATVGARMAYRFYGNDTHMQLNASPFSSYYTTSSAPDTTPPQLVFATPSANNTYTNNESYIYISVNGGEALSVCTLENSTNNISMTVAGSTCYYNMTGLANLTQANFRVYGNDTSGNPNVTEWRRTTINLTDIPSVTEFTGVSLVHPSDNQIFTESNNVPLTYNVTGTAANCTTYVTNTSVVEIETLGNYTHFGSCDNPMVVRLNDTTIAGICGTFNNTAGFEPREADDPSNYTFFYDIATGTFTPGTEKPYITDREGCAWNGEAFICCGGVNATAYLNDCYYFIPGSDQAGMQELNTLPDSVMRLHAASNLTTSWFMGGRNATSGTAGDKNTIWEYNYDGTFTDIGDLPAYQYAYSLDIDMGVDDERFFIIGGKNSSAGITGIFNTIVLFNKTSKTAAVVATFPVKSYGQLGVRIGDYIYFGEGSQNSTIWTRQWYRFNTRSYEVTNVTGNLTMGWATSSMIWLGDYAWLYGGAIETPTYYVSGNVSKVNVFALMSETDISPADGVNVSNTFSLANDYYRWFEECTDASSNYRRTYDRNLTVAYSAGGGDTCDTCSINCAENCVVDTALDCSGGTLLFYGVGKPTITAPITNYAKVLTAGDGCIILCDGGCFT